MHDDPDWLLDLPLTSRAQELPGIAENCLRQWRSARRHIRDRDAADEAFRSWLLQRARGRLVASGEAEDEADIVVMTVLGEMVGVCVSDGEIGDAFTVCGWIVDESVPAGDERASQSVSGTMRFCLDMARDPRHIDRARQTLEHVIRVAPGVGSEAFEDALCEAFQHLHGLHLADRDTGNNRKRTQAAIAVCDAMIERWQDSRGAALRIAAVDARLARAKDLMEIGDEQDAERECARLVADAAARDAGDADDAGIEDRLFMAGHALEAMARVALPEPEFRTEWLKAQRRQDRRESRPGVATAKYTELAARLHAATANLVRRSAAFGEPPLVLLLRNFDIAEQSFAEGKRYSQTFHYRDGLRLVNTLTETTPLVHVASTNAAGLEIDWYSQTILDQKALRPLYLPQPEWQHTVRLLAAIAERVVIWARGKTPGLLEELDILRQLRRTQDTVVLLEDGSRASDSVAVKAALKVFLGKSPSEPVPPLTPDDAVLADFPVVMPATHMKRDDPDGSPFVRAVTDAVAEAWRLSPVERVRRVRERMTRLEESA